MGDTLTLVVGEKGRVVIPAAFRAELGLKVGDKLIGRIESGNLVLESPGEVLDRVRSQLRGGVSPVAELLAERRVAALAEAEGP